jgi:hypothetical protein
VYLGREPGQNGFHIQVPRNDHIDQSQTSHNGMNVTNRIPGPLGTQYHTLD